MTEDTKWLVQLLKFYWDRPYASASKTPRNCSEPKEIGSVTHQYGVARYPIRCQPSGSPFEGYEAGSILSFLWLAFREGHLPSRPFVSSLIYVPRSLVLSLNPRLLPATASILLLFFFIFVLVLIYQRFQPDEGQRLFAPDHRAPLRLPKALPRSRSTAPATIP